MLRFGVAAATGWVLARTMAPAHVLRVAFRLKGVGWGVALMVAGAIAGLPVFGKLLW